MGRTKSLISYLYLEIKKMQDKLDEQEIPCPKCGKEEKWACIRKWGNCGYCVEKEMKKNGK